VRRKDCGRAERRGRVSEAASGEPLARAFEADRRHLFGVCYRMTGSACDAEDLVQATFERALERPPPDRGRPWRPWLTKVAVNLSRDHLRRRRRRPYVGPWLPEPVDTDEWLGAIAAEPRVEEPADTAGRYDLLESVSYAFLVALEALTPTQRAVLLLRDVFEYSGRETADVLGISEAAARQHLVRARRTMADYERERDRRRRPTPDETRAILGRFLAAVASGETAAVEALLAEDVVLETDAGGEYHAARNPVVGRSKVARFYVNIARLSGIPRIEIRVVNGEPAVVSDIADPRPGISPRIVTLAELDEAGRLARIYSVLASRKLQGVRAGR